MSSNPLSVRSGVSNHSQSDPAVSKFESLRPVFNTVQKAEQSLLARTKSVTRHLNRPLKETTVPSPLPIPALYWAPKFKTLGPRVLPNPSSGMGPIFSLQHVCNPSATNSGKKVDIHSFMHAAKNYGMSRSSTRHGQKRTSPVPKVRISRRPRFLKGWET